MAEATWAGMCIVSPFASVRLRSFGSFAAGLTLFTWASSATAEERNTSTSRGIPLNESRLFETQGRRFQIPAGYFECWLMPEPRGAVIRRDTLAFAFWMPSRRYLEVEPCSHPSFRPREPGRDRPGPGEHVVKISLLKFDVSKSPDELTPRRMWENRTKMDGVAAFGSRERFGLREMWRLNEPIVFTYYREVEGTQPRVHLRCSAPDDIVPNPSCAGFVHFENLDLQFMIHFSRNDVETWRESVSMARELILRWTENTKDVPKATNTDKR